MNSASTTARAISFSKKPIALAVSISPRNRTLSQPTRREVTALLAYSEANAGGLMNPRYIRLRPE
ncbi:MAG TPA: hypothetical protein VLT58_15780, partial [Polyangia bacterium]|nr:hypothetical protein [Polyangia bacterium]